MPHADLKNNYLEKPHAFVVPFWHVASTDKEEQVNAKMTCVTEGVDESDEFPPTIIIPMLMITTKLKKDTHIMILKEIKADDAPSAVEPLKKVRKLRPHS